MKIKGGSRTMRTILKGTILLFIFIMALSLMLVSCAKKVDTELFVHKSPDFTLTVPKWVDQKSQDPNSVFKRQPKPGSATSLDVMVSDLPSGMTFKFLTPGFKSILEQMNASKVEILYEREIKLKDGSPAYEFEVKWKAGIWPLRSYAVVGFKDKKIIFVLVNSFWSVGDDLKKYPLSLTLR